MNSNEEYLDNLLKSVMESEAEMTSADGESQSNIVTDEKPSDMEDILDMSDIESLFENTVTDENSSLLTDVQDDSEANFDNELQESLQDDMQDMSDIESLLSDTDFINDENLTSDTEILSDMDDVMNTAIDNEVSEDINIDEMNLFGEDELMSEEDIEKLLSGQGLPEVEESKNVEPQDVSTYTNDDEKDEDLSELIAGLGDNEDLSEINDLLEKADNGLPIDDDVLAMLEDVSQDDETGADIGISEDGNFDFFSGEEEMQYNAENENANVTESKEEKRNRIKEEKRKRKEEKKLQKEEKRRKKQNKTEEKAGIEDKNNDSDILTIQNEEISLDSNVIDSILEGEANDEKEVEKKGFFARLLNFLTEEDDSDEERADSEIGELDEDGLPIGNPSDENLGLLEELSLEDSQEKDKKKKKKKAKKGKKDESRESSENDEDEGENTKKDKKKKEKKEKKPKKEKQQKANENAKPEKRVSKKKIRVVFLLCATVVVCVLLITTLLPSYLQKKDARIAFDNRQYEDTYTLLYGKKLNEQDQLILEKSSIILQMSHVLETYKTYEELGMKLEALDSLVEGVVRYHKLLIKAESYNVVSEVKNSYEQILVLLSEQFGIDESEAVEISELEDDVEYTRRLMSIIGRMRSNDNFEQTEGKQDILPEEEVFEQYGD